MPQTDNSDNELMRRRTDGKFPWQAIAVLLSILIAMSAGFKTWFLNDYRLDQVEKQLAALEGKVDALDEKFTRLDTTYHLLIEQARVHGWRIPWESRRDR